MLSESNIPGVTVFGSAGVPNEAVNLKSWQFAFNRLTDLPEILVQGHEQAYLTWIFATKSLRPYAIEPVAIEEYTRQYSAPGAMRAGFAWYRANFDAEGTGAGEGTRGEAPDHTRLAPGGSEGVGDALRATLATIGVHVRGGAVAPRQQTGQHDGCGHFLREECPDELTDAVLSRRLRNAFIPVCQLVGVTEGTRPASEAASKVPPPDR